MVALVGNLSEGFRAVGPLTEEQADAFGLAAVLGPASFSEVWMMTLEPPTPEELGEAEEVKP